MVYRNLTCNSQFAKEPFNVFGGCLLCQVSDVSCEGRFVWGRFLLSDRGHHVEVTVPSTVSALDNPHPSAILATNGSPFIEVGLGHTKAPGQLDLHREWQHLTVHLEHLFAGQLVQEADVVAFIALFGPGVGGKLDTC